MNRFSRYGFPFPYFIPYRRNNFYTHNYSQISNVKSNCNDVSSHKQKINKKNDEDEVWLELFGIKLYFDDVLILSLLFFLYKENVKDEGLFLALILLLIS